MTPTPADPAAIDLEEKKRRLHKAAAWPEIKPIIAAVKALQERVAELEASLAAAQRFRGDDAEEAMAILRQERACTEAAEAHVVELAEALNQRNSQVIAWKASGDAAEAHAVELERALAFYRADDERAVESGALESVSARPATAVLAATPAKAPERARTVEEIMWKLAQVARAFLATGFGNTEDVFVARDALAKLDALTKEGP